MSWQVGGSFAPPLDKAKLSSYRKLAEDAADPLRTDLLSLCDMVGKFQQIPASKQPGTPHPSGRGTMVKLEKPERLAGVIPKHDDYLRMAADFEMIDPEGDKDLRNAAFHLLWFARELSAGREPMTNDKL